jgi:hypothetical protein
MIGPKGSSFARDPLSPGHSMNGIVSPVLLPLLNAKRMSRGRFRSGNITPAEAKNILASRPQWPYEGPMHRSPASGRRTAAATGVLIDSPVEEC